MALAEKELEARLRRIRHVALDLDGTIYLGKTVFPFTLPFLAQLKEMGIDYTFLTNNSSKSSRDYLAQLAGMGIAAAPAQLYTSTQATIAHLRRSYAGVHRLFVLGTSSLMGEFAESGFSLAEEDAADEPDAV